MSEPRVVRGFITAETVDAETGLNRTIYVGDKPLWEGDEPVTLLPHHEKGVGPIHRKMLKRNVLIQDERKFKGRWIAIPREDFDELLDAISEILGEDDE